MFTNTIDDIKWLKDTALRGVPLPTQWAGFRSFVLQGNEDSPYALNLYKIENPNYRDDYLRVTFDNKAPIYCEYQVFSGVTDKPKPIEVFELGR